MTFPIDVQINAWADGDVRGGIDPTLRSRILGLDIEAKNTSLPALRVSATQWRDPSVGWGLVLPENLNLSPAARATPTDAPEAIRDLYEERGGPVFRVGADWRPGTLRRYAPGGSVMDVALGSSRVGTAPGSIPRYLLIVGGPDVIPWAVQYDLQFAHYVGRLDLDETGLRHYVDALMSGWSARPPVKSHTLVWSVDHGGGDITRLMRRTIGRPMYKRFVNDGDQALADGALFLDRADATHGALTDTIGTHRPSLIVTTSHGETWPLNDSAVMRANLGLLIDGDKKRLDPAMLGGDGNPSGAVWFAQACCSAGSSRVSGYKGILTSGSKADNVLQAVAACGASTAPLPRALLGAENPLAAFVGHVEPTFDWSIKHPETGQYMTTSLFETFHQMLFTGHPIGMAMAGVRETGASFLNSYDIARRSLIDESDEEALGTLLSVKLAARDWQSIVLLGDPTVTVYP